MRASDFRADFHDSKEVAGSLHDEILVWLKQRVKKDMEFLTSLVRRVPNFENPDGLGVIIEDIALEAPLGGRHGSRPKGFIDMACHLLVNKDGQAYESVHLYFEVKTKLNLGETIRQIKYYGTPRKEAKWFVCAPKHPHSIHLEDENIGFIEYAP